MTSSRMPLAHTSTLRPSYPIWGMIRSWVGEGRGREGAAWQGAGQQGVGGGQMCGTVGAIRLY